MQAVDFDLDLVANLKAVAVQARSKKCVAR
jgi:hypothetical protein